MGQKRTLDNVARMSALPPIADILGHGAVGPSKNSSARLPRNPLANSLRDFEVPSFLLTPQALRSLLKASGRVSVYGAKHDLQLLCQETRAPELRQCPRSKLRRGVEGDGTKRDSSLRGNHALGGTRHDKETLRRWFNRLGKVLPNIQFDVKNVWVKGPPWQTTIIAQWVATATLANGDPYINPGVIFF